MASQQQPVFALTAAQRCSGLEKRLKKSDSFSHKRRVLVLEALLFVLPRRGKVELIKLVRR
jgi:hypothetical protein